MIVWLADVLRAAGLRVIELDGWKTRRTRSGFAPVGIVWHHTATSKSASDANVDRLLRDGRSDLPGPLSQLGLRRDGTFVVVAAGRCNHNGYGEWGNDSIGIEAYNDGVGEPWPPVQVDAYVAGTAAICRHLGWGAERVKGHRETDPGRKVDPRGIDMHAARSRITTALNVEDDDMTPEQAAQLDRVKNVVEHLVNRVRGVEGTLGRILTAVNAVDTDEAETARLVLAGLGDAVLSDEQVRSIVDALPQAVKQALREGVG